MNLIQRTIFSGRSLSISSKIRKIDLGISLLFYLPTNIRVISQKRLND